MIKRQLLLLAVLFCSLYASAQVTEKPVLAQIEICAIPFGGTYYMGVDRIGVLNYGGYIKISDKEVINEYKIEEYVSQLVKYKEFKPCKMEYETRAILTLTYEGNNNKEIYYFGPSARGIIHGNARYMPHFNLYKTIYSFMPNHYFEEREFSEELARFI